MLHLIVRDPSPRPLWTTDEAAFADELREFIAARLITALREVLRFDPPKAVGSAAERKRSKVPLRGSYPSVSPNRLTCELAVG